MPGFTILIFSIRLNLCCSLLHWNGSNHRHICYADCSCEKDKFVTILQLPYCFVPVGGLSFPPCSTPPPAFEDAIRGDYAMDANSTTNTPLRHRIGGVHSRHAYREEAVRWVLPTASFVIIYCEIVFVHFSTFPFLHQLSFRPTPSLKKILKE